MPGVTRLGLWGGPRAPYGSFAGKTIDVGVPAEDNDRPRFDTFADDLRFDTFADDRRFDTLAHDLRDDTLGA